MAFCKNFEAMRPYCNLRRDMKGCVTQEMCMYSGKLEFGQSCTYVIRINYLSI